MLRSENPPITSCCLLFAFCVLLTEFNQYCQSPWTLWLGRNRTSARFGNECDDFFFYLLMLCVPVFLPPHPPPRCRRAHVVRSPSRAPHTSVQCVCMCVCVFNVLFRFASSNRKCSRPWRWGFFLQHGFGASLPALMRERGLARSHAPDTQHFV